MSKETPKDDPRKRADETTHKQTDKSWKGNPEKEQRKRSSSTSKNGRRRTRTRRAWSSQSAWLNARSYLDQLGGCGFSVIRIELQHSSGQCQQRPQGVSSMSARI
jgi:hypothetical protein